MARSPRHIQSTKRAVVCEAVRRMGWRGLPLFQSRCLCAEELSFSCREAKRFSCRVCVAFRRKAKRHIQSTKKAVVCVSMSRKGKRHIQSTKTAVVCGAFRQDGMRRSPFPPGRSLPMRRGAFHVAFAYL